MDSADVEINVFDTRISDIGHEVFAI